MKYKKIIALASVCAVLGAGVYFSGNKSPVSSEKKGNPGIDDPGKISGIKIVSRDSTSTLILRDGAWKVSEKQEFPADFNMVSDIVSQFQEMKVERSFEGDDDTLKRLGLVNEPDSGIRSSSVSFFDPENKPLAEYLIGASRKGGGQYFMKNGGKTVYLNLREISGTNRMPRDMMNRQVINADRAKIVKITCEKAGQKIFSIDRQKDSDQFVLAEKEEGREIDSAKITGLAGFISPFVIDDIAAERRSPASDSASMSFELKDGTVCRIIPAGKKAGDSDSGFVNVEVSGQDGDAGFLKGIDSEKYTFVIPKWKLDVMVTDKADFYIRAAEKQESSRESEKKTDNASDSGKGH